MGRLAHSGFWLLSGMFFGYANETNSGEADCTTLYKIPSTNSKIRKVYGVARSLPLCDRFHRYKTESYLTSTWGFAFRYYFTLMPSQRYCYCAKLFRTNPDIGSPRLAPQYPKIVKTRMLTNIANKF